MNKIESGSKSKFSRKYTTLTVFQVLDKLDEEEIRDIQAKHTQDKIAQLKNTEFGKKVKYFEASRLRLRSILFGSGSAINKIGSGSKS